MLCLAICQSREKGTLPLALSVLGTACVKCPLILDGFGRPPGIMCLSLYDIRAELLRAIMGTAVCLSFDHHIGMQLGVSTSTEATWLFTAAGFSHGGRAPPVHPRKEEPSPAAHIRAQT